MTAPITNVAASVRQRLLNIARSQNDDYQRILTQYALERLLYRMGRSPHARHFILKGALLFLLWMKEPHRRTRDLDLLGTGEPSPARLTALFRELCALSLEDDGLVFDPDTVSAKHIREDHIYSGVRVRMTAILDTIRISVQVDIGFGDAVVPTPQRIAFPTLLDFPAPTLLAYSQETVIAEKLSALITLGLDNSRMKDFYDLWVLGHQFPYTSTRLSEAVAATFARRSITMPELPPIGLSEMFAEDVKKKTQWSAFVRQNGAAAAQALTLSEVVNYLADFLLPILREVRTDRLIEEIWHPDTGWRKT